MRADTRRYHSIRKIDCNVQFDVKLQQSHWSVKSRLSASGHSVYYKSVLRLITMHGLTVAIIPTIAVDNMLNKKLT